MRNCKNCGIKKELKEFVKSEIYKGKQYYRHKCKECLNKSLRTGKPNKGRFKKGETPWLGKKHSKETKKKISLAQIGKKQSIELIEKRISKIRGQRRKQTRHSSRKYWEWRDAVKEKDGWKCQHCGMTEKNKLHAHHVIPWKENKNKRFDIENGLTLCKNCHAKEETKDKIGKSFSKETEFKKGHIPWNKGLKNGIRLRKGLFE